MSRIPYIEDLQEWEKSFSFYCPVKVRFCETDAFGHLNNTKAFIYFEEARIEFFKKLGLMQIWASNEHDSMIVAADQQCNYLKQVYFDENLKVYVKVNQIGNSSVDLHYMVKNKKGEIVLTSRSTIVQISKATGKSIPWTEEMRKLLENYK